jgi:hypothetical protein
MRVFKGGSAQAPCAVRTLKNLKFGSFLKGLDNFDLGLEYGIKTACVSKELEEAVFAQLPETLGKTQLYAARLRIDGVAMIIERRWFRDLFENRRHEVLSMHLYTDGSPVCGMELQGMILDILFTDGTLIVLILPGCMMHYGGCRVIDKVLCFLWALHLVAGVDYEILLWIFSLLTSVTTDHGTEIGFCDVPDILGAFLRRLMGVPMSQLVVDMGSRLFWRAVRIPGWSHMWSNLMHEACKSVGPKWPLILNICRVMCSFYRNQTWRKEVVDSIIGRRPTAAKELKSFVGSFKKWRYATIAVAFSELDRTREISETYLQDANAIFGDGFQDSKRLHDVETACRQQWFWKCITAFGRRVLSKCELARRLGACMPVPRLPGAPSPRH